MSDAVVRYSSGFARYVVVTPDLHRIHHSAWKAETNSNFDAVFPVWDLVFGTFRGTARDARRTSD
jgi:sterol desaturase/sphingolipid hydroxylase (fatty acid hydroxylase superfamily)